MYTCLGNFLQLGNVVIPIGIIIMDYIHAKIFWSMAPDTFSMNSLDVIPQGLFLALCRCSHVLLGLDSCSTNWENGDFPYSV